MDPKPANRKQGSPEASVDALEAELREKELEIALLDKQRRDLEHRIRDIHASTSWRVSAPIRAVSQVLNTLAQAVRRNAPVRGVGVHARAGTIAQGLPETIPADDTFVLYRIIGNDLPPRHRRGQSLDNLRFIIEHEPKLPGCEKAFVLNRMVDQDQEAIAAKLLDECGYRYFRIPFDPDDYSKISLAEDLARREGGCSQKECGQMDENARLRFQMALYQRRNNYVMNVNGARNAALADGRRRARWILPWDGNCFLTEEAWQEIGSGIMKQREKKYFLVPMARMLSNEPLVAGGDVPRPVDEPQIIFRADASEQFNPDVYYGHRDKVELLWRLGAEGEWSLYDADPWDAARPEVSPDAACVGWAGWVARLFSGRGALEAGTEHAAMHRGVARSMAVIELLRRLDENLDCKDPAFGEDGDCFLNK